jgi:hypothetical protein
VIGLNIYGANVKAIAYVLSHRYVPFFCAS